MDKFLIHLLTCAQVTDVYNEPLLKSSSVSVLKASASHRFSEVGKVRCKCYSPLSEEARIRARKGKKKGGEPAADIDYSQHTG